MKKDGLREVLDKAFDMAIRSTVSREVFTMITRDAIRLWISQNLPSEKDIFKLLPREWKYGAKKGDLPERIARYTAERILAQVNHNLLEGV